MIFEANSFIKSLPRDWLSVYPILKFHGFIPTLVGGTIRDFLLSGHIGKDLDFELRHPTIAFNRDTWKTLGQSLSKLGRISYLPFEVIRLDLNQVQFEFSPPRREIFFNDWHSQGHSNFEAQFDFQMEFRESVQRRDFTINAMGIMFKSSSDVEFLDPLSGLEHLALKILHPCGEDFQKDSVRFLRAFRFRRKLNFEFSADLEQVLISMPLIKIGAKYFWDELKKSNHPLEMFHDLLMWKTKKINLILPVQFEELILKWDEFSSLVTEPCEHDYWIIALEWVGLSSREWQLFFNLGEEQTGRLVKWVNLSKHLSNISPQSFKLEFASVFESDSFKIIFDWYFMTKHLLQKKTTGMLLNFIKMNIPVWSHIFELDLPKDVKHIDPPRRSQYQVWSLCQSL